MSNCSNMNEDLCMTKYLLEYKHDGITWGCDFYAKNHEDAKAQLENMKTSLVLLGEFYMAIPCDAKDAQKRNLFMSLMTSKLQASFPQFHQTRSASFPQTESQAAWLAFSLAQILVRVLPEHYPGIESEEASAQSSLPVEPRQNLQDCELPFGETPNVEFSGGA